MNKKRLIISLIIFCLIVVLAVVFFYGRNKNKIEESINDEQQEQFKEYSTSEWKEHAKNYFEQTTGKTAADIKLYSDNKDIMIIEIYEEEGNVDYTERYNLNYKTGIGTDLHGNEVDIELEK